MFVVMIRKIKENNMKKYDKLVRDKIPEIIERDNKECIYEIASK